MYQQGYHCIREHVGPAAALLKHGLSDVLRSDLALVEQRPTWRCGVCVEWDRWGARSLAESMLTFGNARCSAKFAAYSVLTYFHADMRLPEACFLYGRVPLGASLVDDLRRRQNRRLAEGSDPHSKLPQLLHLKPTTGDFWCHLDILQ